MSSELPVAPMPEPAVSVNTSPVMSVALSFEASTIEPAVAVSVTSPLFVPR
jgi:hypothetical protein